MKIILTGPFTEADLSHLMDAVRYCERKQPNACFGINVDRKDDNIPFEDVVQFMKENWPTIDWVQPEVDVKVFKLNSTDEPV